MTMTPEDKKLLADQIKEIAKILYKNTPPGKIETLEGIETTVRDQVRLAQKVELSPPNIKQKLTEVCLDGGKVRLRSQEKGKPAYWKEYKTGRLQGIYYGAFFQDNFSLINWVNTQNLARTVYCLGDGHDGVWKLFAQIADDQTRQEILDWYHLKENLYKIQASKRFLEQIEADL